MKYSNRRLLNTTILLLLVLPLLISCGSPVPQNPSTPAPVTTITTPAPQTPNPEPTPPPKESEAPKEIELKYDDGTPDGRYSAGGYFFRVGFVPIKTPLKINKLKLYTSIEGKGYESQKVVIKIIKKDFSSLYFLTKSATEFSIGQGWTIIEIPEIVVNDDFYVDIDFASTREGGVYLFYDSSTINQHSEYILNGVARWPWTNPKEKTNWMIRVIGQP